MITQKDKDLANKLANESFGHHAFKSGVFPTDEEINESLLTSEVIIKAEQMPFTFAKGFTMRMVGKTFEEMNLKPSFAYLKSFYSAMMANGCHRKDEVKVSEIAEFLVKRFEDAKKY